MLGFKLRKGSFGMLDSRLSTRSVAKLERIGELTITGLAAIGCLGTYVVAVTVGLKAFMPLAVALLLAIGALSAFALCFSIIGRRYRLQVSTASAPVIGVLGSRDRSGAAAEEPEFRDAA
jgi:hypothetical protein